VILQRIDTKFEAIVGFCPQLAYWRNKPFEKYGLCTINLKNRWSQSKQH
jgi:hypothetical protein